MRSSKFRNVAGAQRRRLLSGSAIVAGAVALVFAAPAAAQDEAATASEDAEILVTAQKREQALSDVSLSVSAVGAASGWSAVNPRTSSGPRDAA